MLRQICASQVRFIRCIKPNLAKQPRSFEQHIVTRQLRCSGVLEAVRVYSAGYPDRIPTVEFVGRYAPTAGLRPAADALKGGAPTNEAASGILTKLGFSSSDYALGHTKLFLRPAVHAKLQARLALFMAGSLLSPRRPTPPPRPLPPTLTPTPVPPGSA